MGARQRSQQGAVAVVMAIVTCFVVIPLGALAVDLGVQRVARRDMQALADVVALDLSRQLTGGTAASYSASKLAAMQTIAEESRDRNSGTVGVGSDGESADISFELGVVNRNQYGNAQYFTVASGSTVPTAVRVTASASVGFGLANALPGEGISDGTATRTAIATTQTSACFKLGSFAAAIDSSGSSLLSPLNKLLGLNLGLVSYQGLAATNLNLADLAADAHIGSVDTLLNGNVTLGDFTAAAVSVLQQQNDPGNAVAISALQAIQASGLNLSKKVDVLQMISLQSTDTAALATDMNVLDLIAGAIQVANGEHGVDISNLNALGVTGSVKVTQGLSTMCGVPNDPDPAKVARASQVKVDLNVPLTVPAANVLGLNVFGSAKITGGIGNATGRLVSPNPVVCGAGTVASPDTYSVAVGSGLLGLGVNTRVNINGTLGTAQLGLLGTLLQGLLGTLIEVKFTNVEVSVNVGTTTPASTVTKHLSVPQNAYNTTPRGVPQKAGSAFGGLDVIPGLTNDPATVVSGTITMTTRLLFAIPIVTTINLGQGNGAGTAIAAVLSGINTVLNNTVNVGVKPVLDSLLTPLGTLLGVNVGGADVYSVSRPTCNGAKLVG